LWRKSETIACFNFRRKRRRGQRKEKKNYLMKFFQFSVVANDGTSSVLQQRWEEMRDLVIGRGSRIYLLLTAKPSHGQDDSLINFHPL
jgi:hypothetical protein